MRAPLLLAALLAAGLALWTPSASHAAPIASATAAPASGAAPLTVFLDASASSPDPGRTIVSHVWSFGDSQWGAGASVLHQYAVSGAYAVTLTVTDDLGQTGSITVTLTAQSVSLDLSKTSVAFGESLVASGSVTPAATGVDVALELEDGGDWKQVASTTTDAEGRFTARLSPRASGAVRVRAAASGAQSAAVPVEVIPGVRVKLGRGLAFIGAELTVRIRPSSYTGAVTLRVKRRGEPVAALVARVRAGRLRVTVPLPGVGRFGVVLGLPSRQGLAARSVAARLRARGRTLSVGSRGPDVRTLLRRLAELGFRVPGVSSSFGETTVDSVLAFQKANGLPRTGTVRDETWTALERASAPTARYRKPALHIEIDKTRQILLVVKNGEVRGVLPVSSGATGNTPEGAFSVLWKAPATTTWFGNAILYRTLTFYGNFAIHGYPVVPAYPASHGCVRVPVWAADWLYDQSPVGERVYIYR